MDQKWVELSSHFNKKLSKLNIKERSDMLLSLKHDLGIKSEYIDLLA